MNIDVDTGTPRCSSTQIKTKLVRVRGRRCRCSRQGAARCTCVEVDVGSRKGTYMPRTLQWHSSNEDLASSVSLKNSSARLPLRIRTRERRISLRFSASLSICVCVFVGNAYACILCISRVCRQRTTMVMVGCGVGGCLQGGVASVASTLGNKVWPRRESSRVHVQHLSKSRARDRNSKVQACLRVMQIGLKAERAAFTNAPLALSLPSLVSFRPLRPRSSFARPSLVLALRWFCRCRCTRLRCVTRAGKKVHGPHCTPSWYATVKIARMLEKRGNRKCDGGPLRVSLIKFN